MNGQQVLMLDYQHYHLKIIFKGISGVKRCYKLVLSSDKNGIFINKDE
ncbi:hypothetical protein [Geomobilimonas luticola]|uniref:Uncharacterized protein n=1 Tax=Geomobilimonas luticola TaxID=1114878 RepID=A0ABS5SHT0_9BACT|nr:hypothetical protein [Geomobilimonas luticola]MBT0654149.1 hypothetical protein [Geomobilimonas luticola]